MPKHNDYYDKHDTLIIPHATLASAVALILVPAALITARYRRQDPSWFRIHAALNTLVVLIIIVVFTLGVNSISNDQLSGPKADTHHQMGLATFCFVLFQGMLGLVSHFTKAGKPDGFPAPGKSWVRYVHVGFGICTAGVLYATVYTGYHEWTIASDTGTPTPLGVRVMYWILLGIAVPVYLFGFWFARKKEAAPSLALDMQTPATEKEEGFEITEV